MKRWTFALLLLVSSAASAQTTSTGYNLPPLRLTLKPNVASYTLAAGQFSNIASLRLNETLNIGWNVAPGGSAEIEGEPGLALAFESFYAPNSTSEWAEYHLLWIAKDGQQQRPYSWSIDRNTNYTQVAYRAHLTRFGTPENATIMYLRAGSVQVGEPGFPVQLLSGMNNVAFLSQLNAAGNGFVYMAYVDAVDRVFIAPGGHTTAFGGPIQLGNGPTWTTGTGVPTSSCTMGSLYSRTDAAPVLYACEAADTWVAK